LGPDKTYPVIVSDELSPEENEKLLNLLKKHRKMIGYSINDLEGLSPAFCTHRIPMEDQCKARSGPPNEANSCHARGSKERGNQVT
jgi:hypothetical protein